MLKQDLAGSSSDLTNNFSHNPANQITSLFFSNDIYQYIAEDYRTGSYKANGLNQYTNVGGTEYVYDDESRLTSVSGDVSATLTYDPMGRLFSVNVTSGTSQSYRQFLYDGDALVTEYQSNGDTTPEARYVHGVGADVPLVQYSGPNIGSSYRQFLHPNHQGSIIAVSNYGGTAQNTNSYDSFGIPGPENIGRFGYTGQVWLPELGLYHYKGRMYEPRLGRFLQADPVGYEDQMNLYAYVQNDPLNAIDPSGEFANFLIGAAVGAALELVGQIASGQE